MSLYKISIFLRYVTGAVFLVSAFTKALDTNYFGSILASYGTNILYSAAPLIILIELLIGLALLLDINIKHTSLISIAFISFLTAAYSYGVIIVGIKDCGCFGKSEFMNTPLLVYLRNFVLLCCLLLSIKYDTQKTIHISNSNFLTSIIIVFVGAFICGNTFKWNSLNSDLSFKDSKKTALSNHHINEFISTSADSSYLVTVFSYKCPHCLNSIGNIEQYEKFGVVDRVIGIAVTDHEAEKEFVKFFQPRFTIKNYPIERVSKLSTEFPISYIIRNDTIVNVIQGEIPSAVFLQQAK